jgi:hypothetical protein
MLKFCGSSRENTEMRGGTLKLVKMQQANAFIPILSMPSWRQIGVRREPAKA